MVELAFTGGIFFLLFLAGVIGPILLYPFYKLDGGKMGFIKYYLVKLKEVWGN